MRSDGSEQTRLTNCKVGDLNPAVAPDGSAIIFLHYSPNIWPPVFQYMTMSLGSSQEKILSSPGFDKVSFSPDGKYIAFTSARGSENIDIFRMSAQGGADIIRLTDWSDIDQNPAWSPDGKTIAYTQYMLGMGYIYVMNASDGSNKHRLVQEIPGWSPSWSPDGKQLVFWSGNDTATQLYVVDADGSHLRQLTNGQGYHETPAWSPDGQWIAYWSTESGDGEIYIIHPDGTGKTNLTKSPGADEGPEWSYW